MRDGLHEQRLREPWNTDEEGVSAREQRRDEIVDDLVLPHDPAPDLVHQRATRRGELVEQLDVLLVIGVFVGWRGHWVTESRWSMDDGARC